MVLLERTQVEEKREGRKDSYGWSCHTARRKVSTASVAMKGFRSKQETAMDGAAVDPPPPLTSFLIFGFIVGFSFSLFTVFGGREEDKEVRLGEEIREEIGGLVVKH